MTEKVLNPGQILTGTLFNEPMRVETVRANGPDRWIVGLVGTQSERFRSVTLTSRDIESLTIFDVTFTYDGDGRLLRLGLQAYSLGIAYEFDPYFGLSISRVDPLPHQLEAIYDYLLKLARVRFLLADDAGAGKTIMAGLLIRELKLRGLADRTLIVCPANLTFQWQRELNEKFDEKFKVLKGGEIRDQFGINQWLEQKQVITSLDLAKRSEILPGLRQVHWDLTIVDEAHRMSAFDLEHKTLRYRLGELLRDASDHLLLLTATPHKGDPINFSFFLQLLDQDAYADVRSIREAMNQRRAPFYLRRTKEAMVYFPERRPDLPAPRAGLFFVYAIECEGDSYYIGQTDDLQKRWQDHVNGRAAEWTKQHRPLKIAHFEEFSSREEAVKRESDLKTGFGRKWLKELIASGRARQAGGAWVAEKIFTKRIPHTVDFQIDGAEFDLYRDVTRFVKQQSAKAAAQGDDPRARAVGFLMSLYQRRLASSTHAMRHSLENRAKRLEVGLHRAHEIISLVPPDLPDPEEIEEMEDYEREKLEKMLDAITLAANEDQIHEEIDKLKQLAEQAQLVEDSGTEAKLSRLKDLLHQEGFFDHPEQRLLLFTDGETHLQEPSILGNFSPVNVPENLPSVASLPEATAWLNENGLMAFLEEVRTERLSEIDRIAAHVELSLTELLQKADEEIGRLASEVERKAPGAEGRLAQAETRHADLLSRRERRRLELDRQRALSLQSVERITSVLILPHPERKSPEVRRLQPDSEVEATAMQVAMVYEKEKGRQVHDVHEKNFGYDLTSLDVNSGELRPIEVKGIGESAGNVLLTPNEKRVAEDRRDCYWLYVVTDCKSEPQLQNPIKDPARLQWHEVKKVDHYYLSIDAVAQPMQVREGEIPYGDREK